MLVHMVVDLLDQDLMDLHQEVQWVVMECLLECHPMVNMEECRQEDRMGHMDHTAALTDHHMDHHHHHMVGVEEVPVLWAQAALGQWAAAILQEIEDLYRPIVHGMDIRAVHRHHHSITEALLRMHCILVVVVVVVDLRMLILVVDLFQASRHEKWVLD